MLFGRSCSPFFFIALTPAQRDSMASQLTYGCTGRILQAARRVQRDGARVRTGAIKYVSTPDALAARLRPQHLCKLPLMHTSLSSYTPMSCKGTGGGSGVRPQPGGHTLKEGRARWFKPCARHTIRLPCPSATEPTLLRARHRCVRSYPD